MAKGTEAKSIVEKRIQECFSTEFVGIFDKKIYLNIKENSGEVVQVAISMTCPKTPIGASINSEITNTLDFEAPDPQPAAEITQEERNNILHLMEKLGF